MIRRARSSAVLAAVPATAPLMDLIVAAPRIPARRARSPIRLPMRDNRCMTDREAKSQDIPAADWSSEPRPGESYFDGPYLVFTEAYHLRRGFCCHSGCRHCPWGFVRDSLPSGST